MRIPEFRNYMDVRQFFNEKRKSLNEGDLLSILKAIQALKEKEIFQGEIEKLDDLEMDVELCLEGCPEPIAPKKIGNPETITIISPSFNVDLVVFNEYSTNLAWETEKELIRTLLIKFEGNRTKTANALGISIRTLRNKIKEYKENGETETINLSAIC